MALHGGLDGLEAPSGTAGTQADGLRQNSTLHHAPDGGHMDGEERGDFFISDQLAHLAGPQVQGAV